MYIQGSAVEIQTPARWTPIGCGMTAPTPVIAQQYSPAI
jgi:hypothetical protein